MSAKCHIRSFKNWAVLGMISATGATTTDVYWVVAEIMGWHDRVGICISLTIFSIIGVTASIGMYLSIYNELVKKTNQLKNEVYNSVRKQRGNLIRNLEQ